MACSLDKFDENFPDLTWDENDTIDITNYHNKNAVISWVNRTNALAKDYQGYRIIEENNKTIIEVDRLFLKYIEQSAQDLEITLAYSEMQENAFAVEDDNIDTTEDTASYDSFDDLRKDLLRNQEATENADYSTEPNDQIIQLADRGLRFWVDSRKALLKKVNDTLRRFKNTRREDKSTIIALTDAKERLREELASVDYTNPEILEKELLREMAELEEILQELFTNTNTSEVTTLLTVTNIEDRIKNLNYLFSKEGLNGDLSVSYLYEAMFYGLPIEEALKINGRANNIINRYEQILPKIISDTILNDSFLAEAKRLATEDELAGLEALEKELEEILKRGDIKDFGGANSLGATFLGAGAYNNVIARILNIINNRNQLREAGVVAHDKKKMMDSYRALSPHKVGESTSSNTIFDRLSAPVKRAFKTERLVDNLWRKDIFGEPTNQLISPFSDSFHESLLVLKNIKRQFYRTSKNSAERVEAYKNMLNFMRKNYKTLNLSLVPEIADKYESDSYYSSHINTTKEEREEYKKAIIESIGETAYNSIVSKQIRLLEDFKTDPYINTIEQGKFNPKNPFLFSQHFNSEDILLDGDISLPDFTMLLPRYKEGINEEFKFIEDSFENLGKKQDFIDFYESATNLIEYNNVTKENEGITDSTNSIMEMEDVMRKHFLKSLKLPKRVGGSILYNIKAIITAALNPYRNPVRIENPKGDVDYDPTKDRQFSSHLGSSYKNRAQEYRDIYRHFTSEELKQEALKHGILQEQIDLLESKYDLSDKALSILFRNKMVEGIINKILNKTQSFDMAERLHNETLLCQSVNQRRATEVIWNLFTAYQKDNANFDIYRKFMQNWGASNILQIGKLADKGVLSSIDKKKIPFIKNTSKVDRDLKKFLKSQKHNFKREYNFKHNNIHYRHNEEESQFEKSEKNENGETVTTVISILEIEDAFVLYIEDKIKELGADVRVANIISGMKWAAASSMLGANPASGVKNLMEGQGQLRIKAASGLWGFGLDEYEAAYNLFYGVGLRTMVGMILGENTSDALSLPNLMSKIPITSDTRFAKKVEQIKTIKFFADRMGVFSVRSRDNKGLESWDVSSTQSKASEMLSYMAIDGPEFYNQMVGLVAMMQHEKYALTSSKDGKKYPLFDAKTGEFVWNPKTMQLKDEFRLNKDGTLNEDAIANWEQFKPDSKGRAPQEDLIIKFNQMRNASQGNYTDNDKIAADSTALGSSLLTFYKWLFENANQELGTTRIDPAWGRINQRGRLLVAYGSYPHIGAAMAILSATTMPADIIRFTYEIMISPDKIGAIKGAAARIAKVVGGLTGLALMINNNEKTVYVKNLIATRSFKDAIRAFREAKENNIRSNERKKIEAENPDLREILFDLGSLGGEFALRTARASLSHITGLILRNKKSLIKDKHIKSWTGIGEKDDWKNKGLSYEDRLLLSEKVQSYSESVSTVLLVMLSLVTYRFVYQILTAIAYESGEGDEDDPTLWDRILDKYGQEDSAEMDEKRAETIKKVEGIVGEYNQHANYIITMFNGQAANINQWTNPKFFLTNEWSFPVYNKIIRNQEELERLKKKIDRGDANEKDLDRMRLAIGSEYFGTPASLTRPLKGRNLFGYSGIYGEGLYDSENKGAFDFITKYPLTIEEKSEQILKMKRNEISTPIKIKLENQIADKEKELDITLTNEQRKKIVDSKIQDLWKEGKVRKDKNVAEQQSYRDLMKSIDWEEVQTRGNNLEVSDDEIKRASNNEPLKDKEVSSKRGRSSRTNRRSGRTNRRNER